MLAARLWYWVRWASSTMTKMLAASDSVGWTCPRRGPPPGPVSSWNFWIVVITVLTGRVFEDLPQAAHTVGPLRVGEPARGEHPGDLPIELGAVGDDNDGWLLLRFVAPQLEGQPQHGQALARPLRVPDDAAPRARLPRRLDPPHRLVDGNELLVAGQLADRRDRLRPRRRRSCGRCRGGCVAREGRRAGCPAGVGARPSCSPSCSTPRGYGSFHSRKNRSGVPTVP